MLLIKAASSNATTLPKRSGVSRNIHPTLVMRAVPPMKIKETCHDDKHALQPT